MKPNTITFVAGMHGNEIKPIEALRERSIPHIIANPDAVAQGVRFIDKDLNASFVESEFDDTVEGKRAKELLLEIPVESAVIDFHTSDSANVPFAIITSLDMLTLARRTGLSRIVYMKHNIKNGGALIDARGGVSIETGKHAEESSKETTFAVVQSVLSERLIDDFRVYEAYEKITNNGDYTNFTLYSDVNTGEEFYPLFTGETSYSFIGLKCKEITNVV